MSIRSLAGLSPRGARPRRAVLLALLALGLLPLTSFGEATARAPEHPTYRVSFPERQNHYFSVRADLPTRGAASLDLWMAAWTPGSDKIRDYARSVGEITASTPA